MYIDPTGQSFEEIACAVIVGGTCAIITGYTHIVDKLAYASDEWLTDEKAEHNARLVYGYLKLRGWSHNAICATLGNMNKESSINPGKHQFYGPGYGLVQWDPASKYLDWAAKNGYASDSMAGQLAYFIASAQFGQGHWFSRYGYSDYYLPFNDYIVSDLPIAHLTAVMMHSYERPGIPHLEERIEYAEFWNVYFS